MLEKFQNGEIAWELKEYPLVKESTGELGVLEYMNDFNFLVKRIFFLKNIEINSIRGKHSHKELKQLIVCLNGSFELEVDSGQRKKRFFMNDRNYALFLDGKIWRAMKKFSDDAVMLVLCDREYRYDKVIRNYNDFLANLKEVN